MTPNRNHDLLSIERQLTIADVAFVARVNPKTVRRLIAKGELPAHRIGRQWRISPAELARFLRQRQA